MKQIRIGSLREGKFLLYPGGAEYLADGGRKTVHGEYYATFRDPRNPDAQRALPLDALVWVES